MYHTFVLNVLHNRMLFILTHFMAKIPCIDVAPITHVNDVQYMRKKNRIICSKEIPTNLNYFAFLQ